jgi:hypothetical protein
VKFSASFQDPPCITDAHHTNASKVSVFFGDSARRPQPFAGYAPTEPVPLAPRAVGRDLSDAPATKTHVLGVPSKQLHCAHSAMRLTQAPFTVFVGQEHQEPRTRLSFLRE